MRPPCTPVAFAPMQHGADRVKPADAGPTLIPTSSMLFCTRRRRSECCCATPSACYRTLIFACSQDMNPVRGQVHGDTRVRLRPMIFRKRFFFIENFPSGPISEITRPSASFFLEDGGQNELLNIAQPERRGQHRSDPGRHDDAETTTTTPRRGGP